jgi:OOP family OmpA-OmpF porin
MPQFLRTGLRTGLRGAAAAPRALAAVAVAVAGLLLAAAPVRAAPGDQPVKPLPAAPAAAPASAATSTRAASLPARGLFEGEQLSARARQQLTELIIDVVGRQVEIALLVPTGPWQIDGSGRDERDLTPARLESVRRFLAERGVDRKRIYVESRVDARLKEPRLDVQLISRPAGD